MITKTDLDYIEAKTREMVEKVLKTRVGTIMIHIHAKENLDSDFEVKQVRGNPNCIDHDNIENESKNVVIFMPVKEG